MGRIRKWFRDLFGKKKKETETEVKKEENSSKETPESAPKPGSKENSAGKSQKERPKERMESSQTSQKADSKNTMGPERKSEKAAGTKEKLEGTQQGDCSATSDKLREEPSRSTVSLMVKRSHLVQPLAALKSVLTASSKIQAAVFKEWSVLQLAQFSHTSRSVRAICVAEMSRRLLDVTVKMDDSTIRSRGKRLAECWIERTVVTIDDCVGPTVTSKGPLIGDIDERGKSSRDKKFSTILCPLAVHSHIRRLEFERVNNADCLFAENLCETLKHTPIVFKVDVISLPYFAPTVLLLEHITASRVILKPSPCYSYSKEADPLPAEAADALKLIGMRAMVEADSVEIEDVSPILSHLPHLIAPNINTREKCAMQEATLHIIIQAGQRQIVSFIGCVNMESITYSKYSDQDERGFAKRLCNRINNTSDIPYYPRGDVIPHSILVQMDKTEQFHGTCDENPRAFLIGRNRDQSHLVLLMRVLQDDNVAVGIYKE